MVTGPVCIDGLESGWPFQKIPPKSPKAGSIADLGPGCGSNYFAMKPGRDPLSEKARRNLELADWSDRTRARIRRKPSFGKSNRRPVSRSSRNESSGSSGPRFPVPISERKPSQIRRFECSKDESAEQFDHEETEGLDYFAPEAPPPLGLAYPASILPASGVSTYFERAEG